MIEKIKEIRVTDLDPKEFIREKVKEIRSIVGRTSLAISALSGGIDSSTVTILGYKALGDRLRIIFVDNGLMRKGEPKQVISVFKNLGIKIKIVNAQKQFFKALKGITDPEEKREVITQIFYRDVFGKIVRKSKAKFFLHGTILTDVDETVAGIKRQHNIFIQLGIDPEREFGYKIIEPLVQLRKDGVRKVARQLGLPMSVYNRMPFPGPALAARVIGKVTPERIAVVRKATAIVEEEFKDTGAFQCMAILHDDRVTGIKNGKREFGMQIEIRSWNSKDAVRAEPTRLPYDILERLSQRITGEVPGVVSVTYNITAKPSSTMEAI